LRAAPGALLQSNAAPSALTDRPFADQLDPGRIERTNQLRQRVDIASDDAVAAFHPLNRRNGQTRQSGKLPLVDTEKGSRGTKLRGCNHEEAITYDGLVGDSRNHNPHIAI
tara:strand:- start:255 stop:587 length:333 start_codon:yes stop_codon:yes gene_type:complete